jgi:hypothetical protein
MHPSPQERHDYGRDRRSVLPRSALANLAAEQTRPEPVALLESQTGSRIAELTPIRCGRMSRSPFAVSRGGVAHGVGFRRRRPHRPRGAAVRACTPWQLRLVGVPRAQAGLRHQRLRRDGARSPPTSLSPDSQRPMPTATSTTTRHCVGHSGPSTAGRTRSVSY